MCAPGDRDRARCGTTAGHGLAAYASPAVGRGARSGGSMDVYLRAGERLKESRGLTTTRLIGVFTRPVSPAPAVCGFRDRPDRGRLGAHGEMGPPAGVAPAS